MTNTMIQNAIQHFDDGSFEKAKDMFLNYVKGASSGQSYQEDMLKVCIVYLYDMNANDEAMEAISLVSPLLTDLGFVYFMTGKIAVKLNAYETAEKALSQALKIDSNNLEILTTLVEVQLYLNHHDPALELLMYAFNNFEETAGMNNLLGELILAKTNIQTDAKPFFEKAVQMAPKNTSYLNNLAKLDHVDDFQALYDKALTIDPSDTQLAINYGLELLKAGQIEKGFELYTKRHDSSLGVKATCTFTHDLPTWAGQDLTGKSILLCAEQGLGDEILFTSILPLLTKVAHKVFVACDPRLLEIYNRSYDNVSAYAYDDAIEGTIRYRAIPDLEQEITSKTIAVDYACIQGDCWKNVLKNMGYQYPQLNGFLKADPALVDKYSKVINNTKQNNQPKIGISWTSQNLSGERHHYYMDAVMFKKIARRFEADFYVLQYAVTAEERVHLSDQPNIFFFDDVDLKSDLEANLAIMSNLDLSVGPGTATQMLAMAIGCPVYYLAAGCPWYFFGKNELPAIFPNESQLFLAKEIQKNGSHYAHAIIQAFVKQFKKQQIMAAELIARYGSSKE